MVEVDLMRPERAPDFASSELFERTFREGMALVEDAAAYLDGAGRQDSKALPRTAALAYAGESMKLTTRLMQVASWLLVQRAVREGDMSAADAAESRYRLDGDDAPEGLQEVQATALRLGDADAELPAGLVTLVERADRLFLRVLHLDRRMYLAPETSDAPHPVLSQMQRLQAAFGA